ncbi:transposase family protein [Streptomyces sp. NPDC056411]|uniref:transposase family protein n=1 Tax=Streptomyces sp. NPDC056411 TaxID=3345813 RepID=UPI0035DB1918
MVFTDRLLVTLVALRLGLPHTALAQTYGVDRTTVSGAARPGRMHDQTTVRTEGIAEQFRLHPNVKAEVNEGYRGPTNAFPDQVTAPSRKPKDERFTNRRDDSTHARFVSQSIDLRQGLGLTPIQPPESLSRGGRK